MAETRSPVHASCVRLAGHGVLICGASGSGKSTLALQLISAGAMLVGDDYVELRAIDGALIAAPVASIAGLIEQRGVGLLRLPYLRACPIHLSVALGETVTRLPEHRTVSVQGCPVRQLALAARDDHAAAAVIAALRQTSDRLC